jgi:predicted enzyme related to lactoylglutathione lyase
MTNEWARPVVYFEIEALNADVLEPFYREMFNWKIGEGFIRQIPAGIGGPENGISGHMRQGKRSGVMLYIQVKNIAESLVQAVALGGKQTSEPFQIPGHALIAGIEDPEGNPITLAQQ